MDYRDQKIEETELPLFEAIWDVIKHWDINVPDESEVIRIEAIVNAYEQESYNLQGKELHNNISPRVAPVPDKQTKQE